MQHNSENNKVINMRTFFGLCPPYEQNNSIFFAVFNFRYTERVATLCGTLNKANSLLSTRQRVALFPLSGINKAELLCGTCQIHTEPISLAGFKSIIYTFYPDDG
jgi:hypothetical protein